MHCPQCGADIPDEEWNCASCRMNVYWASQHYEDLAGIRQRQGLHLPADTPSFLIQAHVSAMDERAEHGGKVEHKVRQIARRVMRSEVREGMEADWNKPEVKSPRRSDSRSSRLQQEAT